MQQGQKNTPSPLPTAPLTATTASEAEIKVAATITSAIT